MWKKSFGFITVILFSVISILSLFHSGFPPTHDGEYHVVRFYEFYKALSEGILYPRWADGFNNGYGVPLFNFVYPLPNYVSSLYHFIGFSFIDSFKLNLISATVIGGIFFYLWGRKLWGDTGGVVSSIFYLFSPYRFVDIYVRGSVGEVWAMAFLPGFLFFAIKYIEEKQKKYFFVSSIFLSFIIFSHNILGLMFFVFSLFYLAVMHLYLSFKKKVFPKSVYLTLLFGLLLSCIFWLPALYEKQYVRGLDIYNVHENFPELYQLLIPSWGTNFSGSGLSNEMSYQIGIANLIAISISFLLLLNKKYRNNIIFLFFIFSFVAVFFLMLSASSFVWDRLPLLSYFQFPWRFLSLSVIIASILSGSIFWFRRSPIIAISLILIAFFAGFSYTRVVYYHYRDDAYYLSRPNFTDGTNSPGNLFNTIWVKNLPLKEDNKSAIYNAKGLIWQINKKIDRREYLIDLEKEVVVEFPVVYFPGWEAKIENLNIVTFPSSRGLVSATLHKGSYIITLVFKDTLVCSISFFVSFLAFIILVFYYLSDLRIKKLIINLSKKHNGKRKILDKQSLL